MRVVHGDPGKEVGHDERVVRERDGEFVCGDRGEGCGHEIEMVELSVLTLERDVYVMNV